MTLCVGLLCITGCVSLQAKRAAATAHEQWTEDPRTALLGAAVVGPLPVGNLDGPHLLAHFNSRVRAAGLPVSCLVRFEAPPEVLIEGYLQRDILTPGLLSAMGLLEPVGLAGEGDMRRSLEGLNLRQFLWLVTRAYAMNVYYEDLYIVVGYGSFHHQYLAPGPIPLSPGASKASPHTDTPLPF